MTINQNYIETLDGERVEIPGTVPQQYPYQIQEYAKQLAKVAKDPQVYIYKWTHSKGTTERKFYSEACWELETFAIEMFEQLCKEHDWYYDYSDDHSVWTRGRDAESRLKAKYNYLVKKYPGSIQAIWESSNPFLKVKQHA